MSSNTKPRPVQVNIRCDPELKVKLAQAARETNRTLTDFLLDAGKLVAEFPRSARAD
jgi:uncharacterized protein (DUF1778 family)